MRDRQASSPAPTGTVRSMAAASDSRGQRETSSVGSNSTAFEYMKTSPLPGFNPPSPYQYFTQLNDLAKISGEGVRVPLPGVMEPARSAMSKRRPATHQRRTAARSTPISNSDKRQVTQSLTDYIRVFCGAYKGRFLLEDIEQLLADPVTIKAEPLDPFHAQRKQLLSCLFGYFKSSRVHPLHWFDVITSWKGGHARMMTYQEFTMGFQRYCDEVGYATWQEGDLEQVFKFLLRSPDSFQQIRRQDFRFAMKRTALTHRRIVWLNAQARTLRKVEHFMRRVRSKFSDFCPSNLIRKKGKTINLHELESMLFLVLTDVAIFNNCPHADQLLSKWNKKLDRQQGISRTGRRRGTNGHTSDDDENDSGQDSHDDASLMSHDDGGSVGSLLSIADSHIDVEDHRAVAAAEQSQPPGHITFTRKASVKPLFTREASFVKSGSERGPMVLNRQGSVQKGSTLLMKSMRSVGGHVSEEDSDYDSTDNDTPRRPNKTQQQALRIMHEVRRNKPGSLNADAPEPMEQQQQQQQQQDMAGMKERKRQLTKHLSQHLRPEELQYIQSLAGTMDTGNVGGGQVKRNSGGTSRNSLSAGDSHRSNSIVRKHSILQRYTAIRSSRVVANNAAAASVEEQVDDDELEVCPLPTRSNRSSLLDAKPAPVVDPELDQIDPDELAAFEQNMVEKKAQHVKKFKNVTEHFDRRVNLARTRLNQIHR